MKVDMIIPTYKPDDTFCLLLQKLQKQTFVVQRLILLNTEKELWDAAKEKYPIMEALNELPFAYEVLHVKKGGVRSRRDKKPGCSAFGCGCDDIYDTGCSASGSISGRESCAAVCCAAQECGTDLRKCAADSDDLAENGNGLVAAAYARQLPNAECGIVERYTRQFNYPEIGRKKSKKDIKELGIKTFFCSDVCAAYRRDLFLKLGRFETPVIFNEDMFFAARAVAAGYMVEYAADARVIHSHNYSMKQQFHRNFDLAVSQADHPEIFEQVSSESEGMRLVKSTMGYLCRIGKPWLIWNLGWQSVAKYAGYFLGKRYRKLSKKCILRCTMSPDYWKRVWGGENG